MKDQLLIDLAPGWALGFDNLQWVLARVVKTHPGAIKPVAGARLRPVAFITSTKAVLWRCIHENEIELTHEAVEYIDAMPDTFRAWYRWHKRRGALVPEQEAA
jgi:hypothetical protein